MKIVAVIITILFLTFLSLPTAMSLVKKSTNMDKFFSSSDEKNSDNWDEIVHKIAFTEAAISVFKFYKFNAILLVFIMDELPFLENEIFILPPKYSVCLK